MIIDHISNAKTYFPTVKNLDHALDFISGKAELPLGRYEFDGGFILSVEGDSVGIDTKDFESHQDYADVMWILNGTETINYFPTQLLDTVKEYEKVSDCSIHKGDVRSIVVTIPEGFFYVMLPGEGHKPCVHLDKQAHYRKYILKCRQ